MLKKLFPLLLLALFVSVSSFSEDTQLLELQKEAQQISQNSLTQVDNQSAMLNNTSAVLNKETNISVSNSNSQQTEQTNFNQELESVFKYLNNSDNLLTELETYYNNLQTQLIQLQASSNSSKKLIVQLENQLALCQASITSLKQNLENCKAALISNKEDTSTVITELGELYTKYTEIKNELISVNTQLEYYKDMYKKSSIASLSFGTAFGVGTTLLVVGLINSNSLIQVGSAIAISSSLTYCSGRFLFKIW